MKSAAHRLAAVLVAGALLCASLCAQASAQAGVQTSAQAAVQTSAQAAVQTSVQAPAQRIAHVLLVQDSGWMEPFYSDPASPFKPLVAALAGSVAAPGEALVLASFNQSLPGAPSPRALLSFRAGAHDVAPRVARAIARLDTARKPGGAALADTDMGQALRAAIGQVLGGRPGIVWLVTNNRNSPHNDQATVERNREFYALIHDGNAIARALAFPLRMPVRGRHYSANGLMVYAFAVGEQGEAALEALLASGRLARVITEPPARLKPLGRDTVRLAPRRVAAAPGVSFSAGAGGVLRADVAPDARQPSARIEWNLENTMYPYTISAATLSARSTLAGENHPVALDTPRVRDLAPGRPAPLGASMALPASHIPGKWSLAALRSAGAAHVLPGRIELRLADQELALSQAFRERMAALFPGDPLPDIFAPPAPVQASTAVLALEVRVHYGIGPLLALAGGVLAALATGGWAWTRPRTARVLVEDEARTLRGRPGTTQAVYDRHGEQVAQLATTLFGHRLRDVRQGARVRLGRP